MSNVEISKLYSTTTVQKQCKVLTNKIYIVGNKMADALPISMEVPRHIHQLYHKYVHQIYKWHLVQFVNTVKPILSGHPQDPC